MGRTLSQVIAALPKERQAAIETRFQELKAEVEGLQELRRVTGKAQADIAETLQIKQPSVSKIERQTDMYLSTLRNYVEAAGGELDLVVRLPSRPPLVIRSLGDVSASAGPRRPEKSKAAKRRTSP